MWAQQQVGMYVTLICVCVCLFAGSRRTAVCGVEGRRVADKNKQQYVNKAEGLSFHFIKAKWRRSAVATGWSFTRSGKSSNLPCWFYCFVGREKLEKKKAFMIAAMNRWVCVFCGRIYRPFYAYRLVCYDLNIGASPGRHYTTHTITRLMFAAPPSPSRGRGGSLVQLEEHLGWQSKQAFMFGWTKLELYFPVLWEQNLSECFVKAAEGEQASEPAWALEKAKKLGRGNVRSFKETNSRR